MSLLSDDDCTRIYNEANGITTKNPPISTERIFKAMRLAHAQGFAAGAASQLAEKPSAYFLIRSNPGCRDDGLRYGPFWKLADAEELQDSRHSVEPLYTRKEAK